MTVARPITTVLCDLDGTLIDSQRDIALAFQYALHHVVADALPDEAAIAQHIGKPLEHMARELGYPLSPAQLTTFLETYRSRYAAFCVHHTRPYPGVTATLHALSELIAAAGLEHPQQLRPIHFSQRSSTNDTLTFAKLYPSLRPGELIEGTEDPRFRDAWAMARTDSFQPVG